MGKSAKITILITSVAVLLIFLLSFYLVVVIGAGSTGKEELPMFGSKPTASLEYPLAQIFAKWRILMEGSKERAFEERWNAGWICS